MKNITLTKTGEAKQILNLNQTGSISKSPGKIVNDIHSQINNTLIKSVFTPESVKDIQRIISQARSEGKYISVAGGFHAMGGQQFLQNGILLDLSKMNKVLEFKPDQKIIEIQSGMKWNDLINFTVSNQIDKKQQVGIRQKQTGADRLSIGGAVSANIHGRGLQMKPFIEDIESFKIITAEGNFLNCSRLENSSLFRLAIGGYGLFGIIYSVKLRLMERKKVKRLVEIQTSDNISDLVTNRIKRGFLYGDFQFSIDHTSRDFLQKGVFSCYLPVDDETQITDDAKELTIDDWKTLLYLAHFDKKKAFDYYASHYLQTNEQVYWSDTHQLSFYMDNYHAELDKTTGAKVKSSEMITEIYVPMENLSDLLARIRQDFIKYSVDLIYGTIRFIKQDTESFLAWAKQDYACIVFNLHFEHTVSGIEKTKQDFRRIIKRAIEYNGNYYLTYHNWATKDQLLTCYPQIKDFFEFKRVYDKNKLFRSNWSGQIEDLINSK